MILDISREVTVLEKGTGPVRTKSDPSCFRKLRYNINMEIKDKELHRIAVTCIIYNDEGRYLVTKRSPTKKVHPNKWTVPGGGLSVDDYILTVMLVGMEQ